MPEAEVTLRLAFWLLEQAELGAHAAVAIDGAHIRVKAHKQIGQQIEERQVFDIGGFLALHECYPTKLKDDWRGIYGWKDRTMEIRSIHGFDVQVTVGGKAIKAECKGAGQPSTQLSSAIGQVIVSASHSDNEELWIAVPDTPKFETTAKQILSRSPAFVSSGIRIALVGEDGVLLLN
jgi:hypothetical protein